MSKSRKIKPRGAPTSSKVQNSEKAVREPVNAPIELPEYKAANSRDREEPRRRFFQDWNFWVATGTLLLAGIGYYTLRSQESATTRTLNEMIDERRPWIVVDSVVMTQPLECNQVECRVYFDVILKNGGNSPAQRVRDWAVLEANSTSVLHEYWRAPSEDKAEWDVLNGKGSADPWAMGNILVPGQTLPHSYGHDVPNDRPYSPSAAQINAGMFYVLIYVQYDDGVGKPHHTRVAFQPSFERIGEGPTVRDGKIMFRLCYGMSEAD